MAKDPRILDTPVLPLDLKETIRSLGGDADFVKFLLCWHEVHGIQTISAPFESTSPTKKRRVKRRLEKAFTFFSPSYWKEILLEWRRRPKRQFRRALFSFGPEPDRPAHRPRKEGKWMAVADLRAYFLQLTGKTQMGLIQEITNVQGEYLSFTAEWGRRTSWFDEQETIDRLDKLRTFFAANHSRILNTLQTGIPLYEQEGQQLIFLECSEWKGNGP